MADLDVLNAVARSEGLDPSRIVCAPDNHTVPRWNAAASSRASIMVRCDGTPDVEAAVRAARSLGLGVSVHSGGNDWAGRSVKDQGLVIDISSMNAVQIDPEGARAHLGGGVRSDLLARRCHASGLVPVTGTVGMVHMVGLALGGGYGPLNGRFGLACDNLLSAELVTADGTVLRVDADAEPDLLWALRGGGGNFGVVTAAELRLHEVGLVQTGLIVFPWTQARKVLSGLNSLLISCPDELSLQTIIARNPNGAPFVAVIPTWSGPLDQASGAIERVEELGDPVTVAAELTAVHTMISRTSEHFPPGRCSRIRTRNVPELSSSVIERLLEAGSSSRSQLSAVSLHPFHGEATRKAVGDAAYGERRPHQMIEIVGMWEPGDVDGSADRLWADDVHASLERDALPGGYVNLLAADDRHQIQESYGPNAARLLEIKSRVDPRGVFVATPLPGPPT